LVVLIDQNRDNNNSITTHPSMWYIRFCYQALRKNFGIKNCTTPRYFCSKPKQ